MNIYRIELLEPKAKKLLDELVNLKLIKVQEVAEPRQEFKRLLAKIRVKSAEGPTLEDITKEVEAVRQKRFIKS